MVVPFLITFVISELILCIVSLYEAIFKILEKSVLSFKLNKLSISF